jgi:HSP20 family protein
MQIRWAPFNEFARLQGELDRFFGGNGVTQVLNPAFDVREDGDKILVEADLPGVAQEALDLQVVDNVLTVKGQRKDRAFERSFKLPATVDVEKITAALKDGVLTIQLPKKPEAQPRQIKINVNN